ncbi:MAG: hypothetical protein EU547_04645 [Promethearchaeota archaeon]|nr:MAG: hypothetical protein EU547_04645 [Candidatus Lokiarchaeota archaeon]
MTELTPLETLNSIVGLIIIVFFIYIALSLLRKYLQYKDKILLFTAIAIVFLSLPWFPISISFITVLLINEPLPFEIYFTMGYGVAFGMLFWILAVTNMVFQAKKTLIITLYSIYFIIMTSLFYVFLFTFPSVIGSPEGLVMVNHGIYLRIRSLIRLVILLITGFSIWYDSKDSSSKEVKFKGIMIFLGVLFYVAGGIFFTLTNMSVFPLIFFIPSLVAIYLGFDLPDWVKKRFSSLKEDEL